MSSFGYRTHTCGELRHSDVGKEVVLMGWVDTRRDLGGLVFMDLRDRYGLTQIVFSPQDDQKSLELAEQLRSEAVVAIRGTVDNRSDETINEKLETGAIEVRVLDIELLNKSAPLPFMVSSHEEKAQLANEDLRMKYRYLDLRRPKLRDNMILRHRLYQLVRSHFSKENFVEVETPVLMKSTPEGARDYLVPSRVHPGKFYALPQSPQTYKQILMIAGMDRYFQIVKCFRDEDLRADRQPEFTQVDVEMSFATQDILFGIVEELMASVWSDLKDLDVATPFRRMTYADAIKTYGSDKPDLRFGLEIQTVSSSFEGCGFRVFDSVIENKGEIVAIRVPGEGSRGRGAMDRLDKDIVRQKIGAGGLVYFKISPEGELTSSVKAEVLPMENVQKCIEAVGAENNDLVLVLAGDPGKVYEQMGDLRLHVAGETGLIPELGSGPYEFLWVTDFPLLAWDARDERYVAVHHPFTSPLPEDMPLLDTDPGNVRSQAYDLVLNGMEVGGGSIRIHDTDMQSAMFRHLGIDEEEAAQRFGFLLDAFQYGAPPHGGIALGVDRIAMILTGAASLREVIAFPKTQSATELMVDSPDVVDTHQLDDLHIALNLPEEDA